MIKEKFNNFIEKQKNKKPLTLVTDILFVALLILLIIPTTRREVKTFVTKITMTQPRVDSGDSQVLSEELSFSFQDESGAIQNLADLKGQVVFLNFWATWCPPCRAEMPSVQNLYNEYGEKIKFLLVTNEELAVVKNYLSSNSYSLPFVKPVSKPSGKIYSSSIPATFIIGKNGELLLSKKGAAKWDGENIKVLINNHLNN